MHISTKTKREQSMKACNTCMGIHALHAEIYENQTQTKHESMQDRRCMRDMEHAYIYEKKTQAEQKHGRGAWTLCSMPMSAERRAGVAIPGRYRFVLSIDVDDSM